ncbi:MAG: hypothetical protein ACI39F_04275 [Acutalibacteraceae bacterium]
MKYLKNFRLSETAIKYIESIAEKEKTSNTTALEMIIAEHSNNQNQSLANEVAEKVIEEFEKKYKNLFTRLRLATNYTDRNVQIELEMWNTLFSALKMQDVPALPTKEKKVEALNQAEFNVKQRINDFKQQKNDSSKKELK